MQRFQDNDIGVRQQRQPIRPLFAAKRISRRKQARDFAAESFAAGREIRDIMREKIGNCTTVFLRRLGIEYHREYPEEVVEFDHDAQLRGCHGARQPYQGRKHPELSELMGRIRGARRGRLINVYKLLLHNPALAEAWFGAQQRCAVENPAGRPIA